MTTIYIQSKDYSWKEYSFENLYDLKSVFIDSNIQIGAWSKIGERSEIGEGSEIGAGSEIGEGSKISNSNAMFSCNIYKYAVSAYRNKDGEDVIQLGCFLRTRKEWDTNFWNNPKEFPNDESKPSKARVRAYKVACFFLDQLPK